jgi:NAD(P)-dependent dehydrogenase (short-subunit alcohol dehydrogenase family)
VRAWPSGSEKDRHIDLLVNNAGIIIRENMSSPNAAANWRKTLDVNLNGTFNVTLAWLPAIRQTKGSIINVASIAAYAGQGASLGYSPSKGAIDVHAVGAGARAAGVSERWRPA